MTKEEFIKDYCRMSDIPPEYLLKVCVVLPCACGRDGCEGWAVVANNEQSIKAHNELYLKVK